MLRLAAPPSPSHCCRGVGPRDHEIPPVLVAASLNQRNQQQQLVHLRRRHRRQRPATTFAVSSSSLSSSSSSESPPPNKGSSTPVEGAVAFVLECISLARKATEDSVEGLSARCRDPLPPGGRAPRIYFGTGKKTTGLKGLGGAPAAEASEEEEEEEGEEEEASTSSSSPSSPSAQRRRFRTYCKEERAPLAGFASSGFDAGARRVLPRNLLRRAAVLSALELVSGSGEEEGMDNKRRTTRSEGGGGNSLRRVLVRTRIVANSGEEATLTWTVEREDNEANQGCWLVVAVDRDASDDLGPGAAAAAEGGGGGGVGVGALSSPDADAPSPHPRLGPERVACAAALDLASGRPIDRWVWPPVHGWKARAGGRGAAAFEAAAAASGGGGGGRGPSGGPSEREIQQQQSRDLRARWFEIAADVLLHSCPSSSSPVVTVVQSATPEPGWALVETATETAFAGRRGPGFPHFEDPRERRRRKGGGLRTERLQWVLCMGPGGCWGVDAVLRRN